jgi:dihydroneopterin aldolase
MTTEITLNGMRFHARVGIIDHERVIPQPIEVDLTVRVAPGEGIVDYRGLYDAAARVLAADPIEFLEEIADRIASNAVAVSPRVVVASVAVRKPHVALGGPLDYAEVRVERGQHA